MTNDEIKDLEAKAKFLGIAYEFADQGAEALVSFFKYHSSEALNHAGTGDYVDISVIDYAIDTVVNEARVPFFDQLDADEIRASRPNMLN